MVSRTDERFISGIQGLSLPVLSPGEVLIQVAYAAMNYKDALVLHRQGKRRPNVSIGAWLEFAEKLSNRWISVSLQGTKCWPMTLAARWAFPGTWL